MSHKIPRSPCGDCAHGLSRHDRAGTKCRNPGCRCRGYIPLGKPPVGAPPPAALLLPAPAPPPPPPPPSETAPPPREAPPPGPPPIDVPAGGGAGPPPPTQEAEAERRRKAEQFALGYCGWLKQAHKEFREHEAPITLSDWMIEELVFPATVRVLLREGIVDKVSGDEMDNAFVAGPGVATLWLKYKLWQEQRATRRPPPPPRPAPPPPAAATPPPPQRPEDRPRDTGAEQFPDGEVRI